MYLDRLLEALESYYYASNSGCWQDPLSRFLNHLCTVFVRRYNRWGSDTGWQISCLSPCPILLIVVFIAVGSDYMLPLWYSGLCTRHERKLLHCQGRWWLVGPGTCGT